MITIKLFLIQLFATIAVLLINSILVFAYFNYIMHSMDFFIQNDGTIQTYKSSDFNIDKNLLKKENHEKPIV